MKKSIIGLIIFATIAAVAVIVVVTSGKTSQTYTIEGYIGGEKKGFFQDQEVIDILADKFGLEVDYTKAGSVEMVQYEDYGDYDFLFPSSQMALEIFKIEQEEKLQKSDKVFNSPIVLYSWKNVADALISESIVQIKDGSYYVSDFPKLIAYIEAETAWESIGLNLYGNINIICTDPNRSNSGNMYLGLLANLLNDAETVTEDIAYDIGLRAKDILDRLGYMEYSSGNLFSSYIEKGMGSSPIIVGYENQLVEFALENPDIWEQVKNQVVIMYPEPTVWSEHTVIALNDDGSLLIDALNDESLQTIAWKKHGFRTGMMTSQEDLDILATVGIPERIDMVMPMPSASVMEILMETIQ